MNGNALEPPVSRKILVVDDDVDLAESLAELLELSGHEVGMAHDGQEAVEAYISGDFDVAIMDVNMPTLNGVESFLEIRKQRPDARVVMMTGYSVSGLLNKAKELGSLGVLFKPLDLELVEYLIASQEDDDAEPYDLDALSEVLASMSEESDETE